MHTRNGSNGGWAPSCSCTSTHERLFNSNQANNKRVWEQQTISFKVLLWMLVVVGLVFSFLLHNHLRAKSKGRIFRFSTINFFTRAPKNPSVSAFSATAEAGVQPVSSNQSGRGVTATMNSWDFIQSDLNQVLAEHQVRDSPTYFLVSVSVVFAVVFSLTLENTKTLTAFRWKVVSAIEPSQLFKHICPKVTITHTNQKRMSVLVTHRHPIASSIRSNSCTLVHLLKRHMHTILESSRRAKAPRSMSARLPSEVSISFHFCPFVNFLHINTHTRTRTNINTTTPHLASTRRTCMHPL